MEEEGKDVESRIFEPVTLPCGRVMPNRLVKVAMYEHLSPFWGGPPNLHHLSLYSRWSRADWGMLLTGNVQVSSNHLSLGRDIVIPGVISDATLEPFKRLASAMHTSKKCLAIMQLSHTGRQSPNLLGGRLGFTPPLAPSSIRVGSSSSAGFLADIFHRLVFRTPRSMTRQDIDDVVDLFVRGARVALQSGFDGIQLHAAHGYLLAQFLSPKTNLRQDRYCHENGLRIVNEIIAKIRDEAPPHFIIGIKLNAADYTTSATEDHALRHVIELATSGRIDFIEISGGDYENPEFMSAKASSSRQAFFSRFSQEALAAVQSAIIGHPPPLILLTGGFRTCAQLYSALRSRHANLLGIGRYSIMFPDLPLALRQNELDGLPPSTEPFGPRPYVERDSPAVRNRWAWLWNRLAQIKLVGSSVGLAWYITTLRYLSEAQDHTLAPQTKTGEPRRSGEYQHMYLDMGVLKAVIGMWLWVGPSQHAVRTRTRLELNTSVLYLLFVLIVAVAVEAWHRLS